MTINVLLADDHHVIREGIQRILETEDIKVLGQAADVSSAWALYKELKPDVLIMDMSMPGSAGVDGVAHIKQRDSDAKIVVFSIHENPQLVERAIEAGALGYVTKSCPLQDLVKAVQTVYRGNPYISAELAQSLIFSRMSDERNLISTLSAREFNIFCLVAEGKSSAEIAEVLFLAEKTVANYVSQIKQKLEVKNTAEMVHLAIQNHVIHLDGVMAS